MDREGLGYRIKLARKEHGLTGEKLAELCNINSVYLRQIEAGSKTPSLPMFVELCRQLDVSPAYLLTDSFENRCNGADNLAKLLKTATPSQVELIERMIESALSVIDKQ